MATARRLYVYVMSAISVGVLLVGLSMLLSVLFERLGLGGSGLDLYGGEESIRQQLTLGTALAVVSLPVWLIHWSIAERAVRPGRVAADAERSAATRGLYFAVALAVLLAVAAASLGDLIQTAVLGLASTQADSFRDPAGALAALLVTGAAWGYHLALRFRDWRHGGMTGAAVWLPRLYLYATIFVSLIVLLSALTGFVSLALEAIAGADQPIYGDPMPWWGYPLASSVSGVVVGGLVWGGHWWYARRLVADPGARGAQEHPARLRLAFFVITLFVTATAVLLQLVQLIAILGRELLDATVEPGFGADSFALQDLALLGGAVLFALAWWLHRRWLADDTRALALPDRPATVERLVAYAHTLLGLAIAGVGAAWLIGLAIEALAGDSSMLGGDVLLRQQLATATPALVLGAIAWLWGWSAARRRYGSDPRAEAASTTRRAALLIILGVSVLAAIGALGVLLYRLFGAVFGVALSSDVASDVARPIGTLVVAAAAGAFYGLTLRRDQELRAGAVAPGAPVPTIGEGPSGVTMTAPAGELAVRLAGPSMERLRAAVEAARRELPDGYTVEVLPASPPPAGSAAGTPAGDPTAEA